MTEREKKKYQNVDKRDKEQRKSKRKRESGRLRTRERKEITTHRYKERFSNYEEDTNIKVLKIALRVIEE